MRTCDQRLLLNEVSEDPELLTWLAEGILLSNEEITRAQHARMDVAMNAAKNRSNIRKNERHDPKYIFYDRICLLYYDDNIEEAIEWQRKAYFLCKGEKKNQNRLKMLLR